MSNHEQYINLCARYLRDRERELKQELERIYGKPKQALIVGTQLLEIKEVLKVFQALRYEAYK